MAIFLDKPWSTALTDGNGFNAVTNADGDMTWVNGTSSMDGSTGYVNCVVDDTTTNNGNFVAFSLTSTDVCIANLYIDLDTIAIGTTTEFFRIFKLWDAVTSTKAPAELDVYNNAGTLAFRLTGGADADGATEQTEIYNIGANRPNWFEIRVDQATTNVAADGKVTLWLGGGDYSATGTKVIELTGIDNFDEFHASVNFRLGATNISSSVSGQYQFDRFRADDADHILVVPNTAPTITAQASKRMVYGVANAIAFTVADVDDDALTVDVGCTTGTLTAPLAAGAGVTVVSGSGTNALALSGTVAQFTSMGSISYTQSGYTNDTITWDVDDGTVGGTQDTTTVTMETAKFYGGSLSDLNAVLVTFGLTADTEGSFTLRMTSVDSADNTDVDTSTITVVAAIPGGGPGGGGGATVSVPAMQQRKRITRERRTPVRRFP